MAVRQRRLAGRRSGSRLGHGQCNQPLFRYHCVHLGVERGPILYLTPGIDITPCGHYLGVHH